MADPIAAFLQSNGLAQPVFAPDSRYHGLPTAQAQLPDGRTVAYVTRRFLPPPENFATVQTVTLAAGQRADQLAAQYLGVAEQWWRLADANGAMLPEAMVAVAGAPLRITLPEGVPPPAEE
ncbi:MAG: LysM domain-containing protein [Proteobacteria bacterium]|nr:LysM domain-containing protein [Pseudomonadota bacterium]MBS0492782.1 LysM domain-containing protein [Pseudomonadota bacterium]